MRYLALDQSSRISGFAIFNDDTLIDCGIFTVEGDDLGKRLVTIRQEIRKLILNYEIDEIVFEDIQLQQTSARQQIVNNVSTFKVLAQVLGVVQELAQELKIPYTILYSQTWKSALHITGRTRPEQKKSAQAYVLEHYNKKVSQDCADAICIGCAHILSKKTAW